MVPSAETEEVDFDEQVKKMVQENKGEEKVKDAFKWMRD